MKDSERLAQEHLARQNIERRRFQRLMHMAMFGSVEAGDAAWREAHSHVRLTGMKEEQRDWESTEPFGGSV